MNEENKPEDESTSEQETAPTGNQDQAKEAGADPATEEEATEPTDEELLVAKDKPVVYAEPPPAEEIPPMEIYEAKSFCCTTNIGSYNWKYFCTKCLNPVQRIGIEAPGAATEENGDYIKVEVDADELKTLLEGGVVKPTDGYPNPKLEGGGRLVEPKKPNTE